jgi:putative transposase
LPIGRGSFLAVSRLRRIADRDRIFFVTTNLAPGVVGLSADERRSVLRTLADIRDTGAFLLFGYVVMPDHVHLLLMPMRESLPRILHQWKFKTGHAIAQQRHGTGRLWQPRYFDFICRRVKDFWAKLEYVHQNPVEAHLAARPEEWLWSSASHYSRTGQPPVVPDGIDLPADREALLWPAPWQ